MKGLWTRGWILAFSSMAAWAGGGPQNVLVVINDRSIESQEVGLAYRSARGIPERNLVRVSVPPASAHASYHDMSSTNFQTSVVARVRQHIADHGLSNQIDYIVLCQDLPTRVGDNEGASAVLFYGFKDAPKIVTTCSMPTNTASGYFLAERGFNRADAYGGTNHYLGFLLVADRLSAALSNVQSSAESDGTAPAGRFYLIKGSDWARQVRYKRFDNFDFHARFFSGFPSYEFVNTGPINNKTNVMGCLTGSSQVNDFWPGYTNRYLRGSMADHLTSYGGRFPTPPMGQSPAWDWITDGVAGTYGTVNEPCAYLEKFPDPLSYYWYARGFSLGESYWMSVANPYQGVFLGDPLTAPYANPPAVAIANLATNQWISGVITVAVQAATNSAGAPSARVDVYVNDLFMATATNVPPRAGNIIEVVVAGQPVTYETVAGDTLYTAVTSLAGRVNASNLAVRATARGDRIELVYTNFGYSGTGIAYSAVARTGTAAELTMRAAALSSNLLESAYPAREFIFLQAYGGKANTGDTVTCVITLTNGAAVTNRVFAAQDETPYQVLDRLLTAINSDTALQGTNGVLGNRHTYQASFRSSLDARRPGPEGYNLFVDYTIAPAIPGSGLYPGDSFSDRFNDNEGDLTARGNILFSCGRDPLTASWTWDTVAWPNGPHTVRAVARLGTGPETQGHHVVPVVISNSPFACRLIEPTNEQAIVLNSNALLQAETTNASGTVTQMLFYVQGKPHTLLTNAPWVTAVSTLDYGVGRVSIQARAWEDGGASAVSDAAWLDILRSPTLDTDGDGIADSWEQRYFGGLYVYGATNDPDGDGVGNYAEYIAATDPTSAGSYFRLSIPADEWIFGRLSFLSDTGRLYEVQYNSDYRTNFNAWQTASPAPFPGTGGITNWTDDGSETDPPPDEVTQRLYRVRVALP